jgi:hypothetical protein
MVNRTVLRGRSGGCLNIYRNSGVKSSTLKNVSGSLCMDLIVEEIRRIVRREYHIKLVALGWARRGRGSIWASQHGIKLAGITMGQSGSFALPNCCRAVLPRRPKLPPHGQHRRPGRWNKFERMQLRTPLWLTTASFSSRGPSSRKYPMDQAALALRLDHRLRPGLPNLSCR